MRHFRNIEKRMTNSELNSDFLLGIDNICLKGH